MQICPYPELLLLPINTTAFVDQMRVVRDDGIAAVLGDDTDGYDNGKPPSVPLGPKEVQVAGAVSNLSLYPESFLDFTVLELDSEVVLVAVGVVFGQEIGRASCRERVS